MKGIKMNKEFEQPSSENNARCDRECDGCKYYNDCHNLEEQK